MDLIKLAYIQDRIKTEIYNYLIGAYFRRVLTSTRSGHVSLFKVVRPSMDYGYVDCMWIDIDMDSNTDHKIKSIPIEDLIKGFVGGNIAEISRADFDQHVAEAVAQSIKNLEMSVISSYYTTPASGSGQIIQGYGNLALGQMSNSVIVNAGQVTTATIASPTITTTP